MHTFKHIASALICFLAAFLIAKPASANEITYGWQPTISESTGKVIGMSNIGERGGVISLSCNVETQKLKLVYAFEGKLYDMFVFRKFGSTDMSSNNKAGKFLVGSDTVSQADVYYNIMNADKSFTIARFVIGSKDKWDKAIKANAIPAVEQEGDEQFLVGDDYKKFLGALSVNCPFKATDETAIF